MMRIQGRAAALPHCPLPTGSPGAWKPGYGPRVTRGVRTRVAAPESAAAIEGESKCPVSKLSRALGVPIQPISRKPLPTIRVLPDGETSKLPLPPGPPFMYPLVGETFLYSEKGPMQFGLDKHAKYGPVFKTSLWGMDWVMITDQNMHRAFMAEDTKAHNFHAFGTFAKVLGSFGSELLTDKDKKRMPFRRSMMAALSNECLQNYAIKIADIAERELQHLAAQDKWELSEESRKLGMTFANSLLAGLEGLSPEEEKMIRNDLATMFDGLITFDIDLPGTPLNKAMEARRRLVARIEESIEAQRSEIMKEKEPVVPGTRPRKNMLGYMIDEQRTNGGEVSIDMPSLALGVLQAGTDTSSAGFNAQFAIVAQLPEVMEAIREEQARIQAQFGPKLTKQALDASTYLDAVVRETLRLNSPGAAQFRLLFKEMEVGGYRLPAGTAVFLNGVTGHALELNPDWPKSQVMTHMDLKQLRESFRPERWMDDATRPTLSTFGFGPHNCVGMALYIMEAKALMATIARKYELELLTPKFDWLQFPLVKPDGEVFLRTTLKA